MSCPECQHPASTVSDTRRSECSRVTGLDSIRRRRECAACGHRFTTMEVLASDWPDVDAPAELSAEALRITAEVIALLDARLAHPTRSASEAARSIMRYNPDVTPADLSRALGVSRTYARQLHGANATPTHTKDKP